MKTYHKSNRCKLFWVALLGLMVATGCGSGKKTGPSAEGGEHESSVIRLTPEQVEANGLVLGKPQEYLFSRDVTASGYLEALPRNYHAISVVLGGTISELNLLPGDRISRGQFLFRISNLELLQIQEDYLTSTALLALHQDEYERQKLLASENVTAQKVFVKAESELKTTAARVQALENRLTLLHIDKEQLKNGRMVSSVAVTAPISGFVTRVDAGNGQYASPDTKILEIVETSPLLISLQVFEKDILHVREGQVVRFRVPEATPGILEARITKTGKVLNENRMVNVHAVFKPGSELRLLPGMFVKASIITQSFQAMALPQEAIIPGDGFSYVLVKTNPGQDSWVLEKAKVTTGYQDQKMTEILPESKLSLSDNVVVGGAFSMAHF
ncbi:MAG TPA: efflux RND transporter periplasmic adaptor subunit [Prolixibacteraceae bacterium]|nr:efflux RND transporter periplasmic adaptor subunit [Prolixibacteraceae bacterium]HQE51934.1 efflux RND transporter periplasmic adaptor subunit [Prolixibacteraceae bacterium]HQH76222.1 efflux RND transporter periplasmic adaptor subunit [Prolixibacteraceae bacterium]HQJ85537.1 efflux RND transporter periplasmic adaptor subunit [Prolixibacteraceae bacterium]